MIDSILKRKALPSAIAQASVLHPEGGKKSRNLDAGLLLTALIDAFSILVIFLLMSFSTTGDILFISKGMELPKSAQSDLIERAPIVKIDEGKFYLEDKEVQVSSITEELLNIRKKFIQDFPDKEFTEAITVQADRRTKYEVLNQIIVAASQAGISDIRFATLIK